MKKFDKTTLIGASISGACSLVSLLALAIWSLSNAGPAGARPLMAPESVDSHAAPLAAAAPAKATTASPAAALAGPQPSGPGFHDKPEPYDLAAIRRDPAAYYSRCVPNRVWQKAPLARGESRREDLLMQYEPVRFVLENGKRPVPMEVRGKPGRPVTFTALDTGRFANGRISITVPADEFGYARADFWVGNEGQFRVLAGSPENRGPVEFSLQALPAQRLRALESGEYARNYLAKLAARAEKARREKEEREKVDAARAKVAGKKQAKG